MNIVILIAATAVVTQVAGHILYCKSVLRDRVKPNATAWLVWGVTSIIDTWNYGDMTNGDVLKNALPWACTIGSAATFLFCLKIGKLGKPEKRDLITVGASFFAIYLWQSLGYVAGANMVLQLDNVVSFIPIIFSTRRNPHEEHPLSWGLWTVSYLLGTSIIFLQYTGEPVEFAYPFLNAVLHGLIFLLCFRLPRRCHKVTA